MIACLCAARGTRAAIVTVEISVFEKAPGTGPATKIISPTPDGVDLIKDGSHCRMWEGTATRWSGDCRTEQEAQALKADLQARLAVCRLELHPTKTKIVYCKDGRRKEKHPNVKFDFLGYGFRPRWVKNSRSNELFCGFTPAVSATALKAMRTTIRDLKLRSRTDVSLADIARKINPLLWGWIEYYGRYMPSALRPFLRYVNQMLRAWAMRKFKRFAGHTTRTGRFLEKLSQTNPRLFVHWQIGMIGTFA
jgi:RNA-directed DNA polymerase